MKFTIVVLAAFIACVSALTRFDRTLDGQWEQYKKSFNKLYQNSRDESYRRMIWERNHKLINDHNMEADDGKHTYRLKMNQFGDMTRDEINRKINGFNASIKANTEITREYYKPSTLSIPDSVDWRTQGYVTPIKDQANCGSCWAFSAVASLEGQHFKASGKLVSLSEQNLIDCSNAYGNQGCNGGLMDQAFQYIRMNHGIDTETSYPYKAVNQVCQFQAANIGATDSGFVDIQAGSEAALQNAIATIGPISVAIDASQSTFHFYSSGIYYDPNCSSTRLDHGVTAVGYGSQGGQDYYIVKNSWGLVWGNQGYIMMSRNRNNNCGIATMSSYPTV